MKLSFPALAGALVGTAALASFAAVPAEAASASWSLSSLWNSAAGAFGGDKAQGSFTAGTGGTRRGRRLPGNGMGNGNGNGMGNAYGNGKDMDGTEDGMEEGGEFDYTGLTAEEIAEINGEEVGMGGMDDMGGMDGMEGMGNMGMGMGMGMNNGANNSKKNSYLDHLEDLPPYNGPQDDPEQAEGMVGLESIDDQGDDPVAAEDAEKLAAMEAMDAQEAADEEFELDAAADLLEAQEEELDHQNDENADDPSAGAIKPDEVEKTDVLAKEDEESEAPALPVEGLSIEAVEAGELSAEAEEFLLADTIKEEVYPEQAELIEEAAAKDEMPAAPDEEVLTEEQLKDGVQAAGDDEDEVTDVPDDGTTPDPEEPVPEGDSIKATEGAADEGLVTDGKPPVLAAAEEAGIDLDDIVANAIAATDEAEDKGAPDGVVDHGPKPEEVKELLEELGTPDFDLSAAGTDSEYAESFGFDDDQDPDAPSEEVLYEQQHTDEMVVGIDNSMFTTAKGEGEGEGEGDTDVARRRRRAAETTYTPV